MRFTSVLVSALLAAAQPSSASSVPTQSPAEPPIPGSPTSQGCFSDGGNLTDAKLESLYLSSGACLDACQKTKATVMALSPGKCLCGTAYPPEDSLVDDEKCDFPCAAYPLDACGGRGDSDFFSVFNTGVEVFVPHVGGSDGSDDDATTKTTADATVSTTFAAPSTTSGGVIQSSSAGNQTSGSPTTASETSGPSTTGAGAGATETTPPDDGAGSFNYSAIVRGVLASVAITVAVASIL